MKKAKFKRFNPSAFERFAKKFTWGGRHQMIQILSRHLPANFIPKIKSENNEPSESTKRKE